MARSKLSEASIASLPNAREGSSRVYYDSATRGLAVRVTGKGTKTMLFCYGIKGVERRMPLGEWKPKQGTLEWARKRAEKLRREVDEGVDPVQAAEDKRETDARTRLAAELEYDFDRLAKKYITEYASHKRSGAETIRRINAYVLPVWGKRKVKDITRSDVDALVSPVAFGDRAKGIRPKPAEANQRLALVRKMFSFAFDKGIITTHPCLRMQAPGGEIQPRTRALRKPEEFKLFEEITGGGDWAKFIPSAEADALRVAMFTGCRASEVATLKWADLDLVEEVWMLPASGSKTKRPNYIPLLAPVVAIFKRRQDNGSEYVFPAQRSISLTKNHLSRVLKKASVEWERRKISVPPFTPHDLRRTVETGMAAAKVPKEYRDRVLNHADSTVGGKHYDQHDYIDEKREALEKWYRRLQTMLRGHADNVVQMRVKG